MSIEHSTSTEVQEGNFLVYKVLFSSTEVRQYHPKVRATLIEGAKAVVFRLAHTHPDFILPVPESVYQQDKYFLAACFGLTFNGDELSELLEDVLAEELRFVDDRVAKKVSHRWRFNQLVTTGLVIVSSWDRYKQFWPTEVSPPDSATTPDKVVEYLLWLLKGHPDLFDSFIETCFKALPADNKVPLSTEQMNSLKNKLLAGVNAEEESVTLGRAYRGKIFYPQDVSESTLIHEQFHQHNPNLPTGFLLIGHFLNEGVTESLTVEEIKKKHRVVRRWLDMLDAVDRDLLVFEKDRSWLALKRSLLDAFSHDLLPRDYQLTQRSYPVQRAFFQQLQKIDPELTQAMVDHYRQGTRESSFAFWGQMLKVLSPEVVSHLFLFDNSHISLIGVQIFLQEVTNVCRLSRDLRREK